MKRSNDIPEIEEVASVACAVQNLYLSLAPYGIGGYWSTGGIVYMDAAKDWLGLSSEDKLMGFFFLGYVKVPSPHRTPGALEEKIHWVRGGEM
jgi:nitroreductase